MPDGAKMHKMPRLFRCAKKDYFLGMLLMFLACVRGWACSHTQTPHSPFKTARSPSGRKFNMGKATRWATFVGYQHLICHFIGT